MTNMAASTGTENPAASSEGSTDPAMGGPTLQYSMVLDHLIGDRRPVKDLNPAVMGALPMPPKTDEQKMIERGMESCAFKSVLACVGGKCLSRFWFKWKNLDNSAVRLTCTCVKATGGYMHSITE